MSGDFSSQYLQANGNGSFTGANTQQMNTGYEVQQHHSTYPWMGSDQQLVPNQTITIPPTTLNASNVATTSSEALYHTQSSETNNNFIQGQTPIVGSNVRKSNIKQADNNVNANVNTTITTNSGVTIGNNQNRTPEYIDYTQKCVQLILEINYELIRVCIDYQNKGISNDQDLAMYKSRLQANLSYLATVADEYNGNSRNPDLQEFKQKMIPDLSPLPVPRSNFGQKINTLLQRAGQVFVHQKKYQRISTNPALAVLANNNAPNNNNSNTITASHMLDPSSTSPPRQFKMGQPPNSSIIGAVINNPSEYQLYQKQQQQQQQQQQQPPPPSMPPQHPQQVQHQQKSQQSSSQSQQKQMLQQQSQQLHQSQQNSQQSANRFANSMVPTATISTTYQQHHPTPQHQNMSTNNISDYTMMNASTNSEQSYQVSLPPLVGMGNMSMGNTGAGNGGAGNIQGPGILPSIIGIGDQYGMPQQQQLQQLQNVGYTGYMGGGGTGTGISGTGFGTTNTYGMMRYPSAGGSGMGNNPLAGNSLSGNSLTSTVMGGGGNGLANNIGGIMSGNNYGNNTIVGNSLGLPSMMNHDNGMG